MEFLERGRHRIMARTLPKPIEEIPTAEIVRDKDDGIPYADAWKITELVKRGVEAANKIEAVNPAEPINAELLPINEYSAEVIPIGDRFIIEVDVDVFDSDGELIKTIAITETVGADTTAEEIDQLAEKALDDDFANSPGAFGVVRREQLTSVARKIIYAERAF